MFIEIRGEGRVWSYMQDPRGGGRQRLDEKLGRGRREIEHVPGWGVDERVGPRVEGGGKRFERKGGRR